MAGAERRLIATEVTATHVHMLLGDGETKEAASEWIEFQVSLSAMTAPDNPREPLGHPQDQFLGGVQLSGLLRAQAVIDREIQRLRADSRRIR